MYADDTLNNYTEAGALPIASGIIKECGGLTNASLPISLQTSSPSIFKFWASMLEPQCGDNQWFCPVISGRITDVYVGLKNMDISLQSMEQDSLVGFRMIKTLNQSKNSEDDTTEKTVVFNNVTSITVNHTLKKCPDVWVTDENGNEIECEIVFISISQFIVKADESISGTIHYK